MVLPVAAIPIAAALISAAAQGAGQHLANKQQKRDAKRRAKSTKRETYGDLFDSAHTRGQELEAHRLSSSQKHARKKTKNFQDTADLVRGAFNI